MSFTSNPLRQPLQSNWIASGHGTVRSDKQLELFEIVLGAFVEEALPGSLQIYMYIYYLYSRRKYTSANEFIIDCATRMLRHIGGPMIHLIHKRLPFGL